MPAPGSGSYHTNLLRVANLGIAAGVPREELFRLIREATPRGSRVVPDTEIRAAVVRAAADIKPGQHLRWKSGTFKPARPTLDAGKLLRSLLARGEGVTLEDLSDLSPYVIEYRSQSSLALEALYEPTDQLFIGDTGDKRAVRPVHEWLAFFKAWHPSPSLIIPNPLSGLPGLRKDGKTSYRCDACVAKFKFAVVEFDTVPPALCDPRAQDAPWPFDEQAAFWAGAIAAGWPVAALIHSGGKSVHGWLAVNAANAEEWERDVEQKLFRDLLEPLGVDSACKNESRLSRMPGAFRIEKKKWQTLLYLNPAAGEVKS